jgi:small-conductance mechanosensitive channel
VKFVEGGLLMVEFPVLSGETLWAAVNFIIGLAVTFIIVYFINSVLDKYFGKITRRDPKLLTTFTFLRRLIVSVIALIGVMSATFTAFPGAQGAIASVFVAAGFASIVIGLAAQSSLSNIISGVVTSISQPFRIGDAIMFRKDFCFVEDMKLMHTVLRTWDNRRLVVPNAILQNEVIINYSVEDPTMLVPVYVQVSYESDLEKAMQVMVEVARRHPDCIPTEKLPNAVVMEFQDSGILLRLLSKAKDQPTAWRMARDLLLEIKKEFDRQGIEIPYPRRYLVAGKELQEQVSELTKAVKTLSEAMRKASAG